MQNYMTRLGSLAVKLHIIVIRVRSPMGRISRSIKYENFHMLPLYFVLTILYSRFNVYYYYTIIDLHISVLKFVFNTKFVRHCLDYVFYVNTYVLR